MNAKNDFLETLLKQGPQLSAAQYAEYRRQLHEKLARFEREEKSMRRIVYVTCGLTGALYLGLFGLAANRVGDLPSVVASALVVGIILLPLFTLFFLMLYFLKYRPRLQDANREDQRALLVELQRQLNELRDKLPPSSV